MQHPAAPELAHTTPRPIHWVATATAVSGAIALASVLHPASATAAQPQAETKSAPAAPAPPDPAKADFPLDCGPTKILIVKQATGDLDGDGRPETVAVVHCDASMGTPPDGVYVLTRTADAPRPRVVATLVNPKDRLTVTDFTVRDASVTATLLGYSSADVPSCCPDVKSAVKWQWKGGAFIRSTPSGAQTM
ncbi:hypothetical protein AAW14_02220 [Streptomyces hygroscopicus]|uniref:hypothetical protein n=1 Tax=Streptomyces hygroscopicus TaxID=1912 RepID=UPI002240BB38|nr:hypothetical protein [Streptomyces hygroscopicus]MCW7940910.1 hypothetical protein [Streptomyces hygroscopicus]